jgi:uncharacterized membrane protein YdbT with pleckstrin-like domain
MGYPDNVLATDERVVLHRHPHWKRLIGPVLALLVCTLAASFAAAVVSGTDWEPRARQVVSGVVAAIWLALVAWLTLRPFFAWFTTHFVITDRRVMYRHGVLTRAGSIFRWRASTVSSSVTACSTGWCAPAPW